MEEDKALTNLIVNYIPANMTDFEYQRLFEPFGPIKSSKIVRNESGESLCYGFIKYIEPQSALDAIHNLNGLRIYNKVLKVAHALPHLPRAQRSNNLFIKNLPKTITLDELEAIFKPYGNIVYSRILYEAALLYTKCSESDSKRLSTGTAFIRFEKQVDEIRAIRSVRNTIPPGFKKPLEIRLAENTAKIPVSACSSPELNETIPSTAVAISKNQNERLSQCNGLPSEGRNLIVRNLSPQIDEAALWAMFEQCGNVLWIKIARHRDGQSRQYGFVEMETISDATRAIQSLGGGFYLGHKLCVKHNNNLDTLPFSFRCEKKFRQFNR